MGFDQAHLCFRLEICMARNFLRRSGPLLRFGESGREVAAAWLLALFIAAAVYAAVE
jgi:hypothetical protein